MTMKPIAHIRSDFPAKFGIPRQAGLVPELQAAVVFEPHFRNPDAIRGIEEFSHIWLIWEFSAARRDDWKPMVRPPRLGGEQRLGVFATRSPFRPNPIGLSSVRLLGVEHSPTFGPTLVVGGADLMNGTPILDIKPYIGADMHEDAALGFTARGGDYRVRVEIPDELLNQVPAELRDGLLGVLAENPRPAYQTDPERVYGMSFAGLNVRFQVAGGVLTVVSIETMT
ncbi:tRNA (N6-threonylcarbamoyladenosine(37)-N6)-methyltransferase TrmO [Propionimicrobium sp. PCR01-08-3]|uniref:tRNA (N6-threonylcarbamoyladenosine(37)-N6)-methyltransferase TrmO n=1 Tax=Propionimicrobium sp. PCR01-08-3 TaxID=3052086 RepID=UPI00255C5900|nr:tRNA (N6-threonylcarbamoyladenosine(37)-N6)-methyltransferase TrmO [Propionimicrobium sp. PCR01-08-3]WIY84112.1 tRNA (N6-threonylcarbamoyladenosine(37)-N6)-methyltransferase TrmO [Propionimicrobium sp. PCR01-08-3]